MYEAVLDGARWLQNTPVGVMVRDSTWMYPVMKWVHFVGLSIFLAAILTVDLRLIGVGGRRQTAVQLTDGLLAWRWIGFLMAFVAGFLLFSVEATTYVSNIGFVLKIAVLLPLALIWHLVVHSKARTWTQSERSSAIGKWAGLVEFLLWTSVVAASIGFLLTNPGIHP